MLSLLKAGPYTIRGVSVAGIYTSLQVKELGVVLDLGLAPRGFCGTDQVFLSHAHVDHISGLAGLLGVRGMMRKSVPLRVYMPEEVVDDLREALAALGRLQHHALEFEAVGMAPGDECALPSGMLVRAFRTYHTVPSLGFQFFRRVNKLRAEFSDLPGPEIGRRRRAGEDLFEAREVLELAYATDTLPKVLEQNPDLFDSRVLVMECSFLDERKSLEAARKGGHVHLDELLGHADAFRNEALVLMHFSQIYSPREVRAIFEQRWPSSASVQPLLLAPERGPWPG